MTRIPQVGKSAQSDRVTEAVGCYDRALDIKPDYLEAWNNFFVGS